MTHPTCDDTCEPSTVNFEPNLKEAEQQTCSSVGWALSTVSARQESGLVITLFPPAQPHAQRAIVPDRSPPEIPILPRSAFLIAIN